MMTNPYKQSTRSNSLKPDSNY